MFSMFYNFTLRKMNFLSWLLENDTNGWHLICLSTRPYFTSLVKQTVIITSGTVHFLSFWGMEDSNFFANADKPCSFQERILPHHILWKNNSHWWVVFGPNCLPLIYFTGGPLHQAITLLKIICPSELFWTAEIQQFAFLENCNQVTNQILFSRYS